MKKILISASIFALSLTANAQGQFISDTNYRNTVENIFKERVKTVGKTFYNTQKENLTADEQEALKFLYAYMPLADVTDYPTSFFADNVRMSFKARKEMPWGKNVPELLFRHFVVPIRVNNEALDNARSVFYNELKDRIWTLRRREYVCRCSAQSRRHTCTPGVHTALGSHRRQPRLGRGLGRRQVVLPRRLRTRTSAQPRLVQRSGFASNAHAHTRFRRL